jgi:hypothetical protein
MRVGIRIGRTSIPPEKQATMAEYGAFGAAAAAVMRAGAALYPTSTGTTVQVEGGKGGKL